MRLRMLMTIATLLLATQIGMPQTMPLKVLASNGMKAVVQELQTRLEREVGRPLAIEFNTSAATRQRIESGEAFDAVILTTEIVNELTKGGQIATGSVVDLGRSGIGFGIRSTATKPDVRTPEAVQQTLLKAKSLTWVSAGASRVHIDRMIESLGITSQVKSKIVLTKSVDESLADVASGKTEMIITLTSEILPAKGVQYVGPLPAKFQNYVAFSGGVSPKSSAVPASTLLIKALAAPSVARTYESKGMELPVATDLRPRDSKK